MEDKISLLVDWLSGTQLSSTLSAIPWFVPFVQCIHILSMSLLLVSAAFVDLRIVGVFSRRQTIAETVDRFIPVVWWILPILAATGTLLTIAEPARELLNPTFWLKMSLLVIIILLTALFIQPLGKLSPPPSGARAALIRAAALLSLLLWGAILVAGRMIAYDTHTLAG